MSNRLKIPPGTRYGKLTVIQDGKPIRLPSGQVNRTIECLCDCGRVKTIRVVHLVRSRISSCGWLMGEQHGESKSKLYNVWRGMKNRCYRPAYSEWHLYGGKGVKMCDEWRDSFICFRDWAKSNGWQHGLPIDRINGSGNYEPGNCRFVTPFENCCNTQLTIMVSYKGGAKITSTYPTRPR